MYTMMLMMAVSTSGDAAAFGKHKGGCNGCTGAVVAAAPAGCTGSVAAAPAGCTGTVVAEPAGCTGGGKHKLFGGGLLGGGLFSKHKAKKAGCHGGEVAAAGCHGSAPVVVEAAPAPDCCSAPVVVEAAPVVVEAAPVVVAPLAADCPPAGTVVAPVVTAAPAPMPTPAPAAPAAPAAEPKKEEPKKAEPKKTTKDEE